MQIDHFLYQVPDLEAGAADIAARTGLTPRFGGVHANGVTANYLARLGAGLYLEIIGPAPGAGADTSGYLFGNAKTLTGITTFAVRAGDIAAQAAMLRARSMTFRGPITGGRTTPQGQALAWKSIFIDDERFAGFIPFALQWLSLPHPSETAPAGLTLKSFEIFHPLADDLNMLYETIGVPVHAIQSPSASMRLMLASPNAEIELRSAVTAQLKLRS